MVDAQTDVDLVYGECENVEYRNNSFKKGKGGSQWKHLFENWNLHDQLTISDLKFIEGDNLCQDCMSVDCFWNLFYSFLKPKAEREWYTGLVLQKQIIGRGQEQIIRGPWS